jgi:hypothetical protein
MLAWSERWRAVAQPAFTTSSADEELQAELGHPQHQRRLSVAWIWVCKPVAPPGATTLPNVPYGPGALRTLGADRRDALHLGTRGFVVSDPPG